MIVWLWDAPGLSSRACGISATADAAERAAAACLRSGQAGAVVVEAAVTMLDAATITYGYRRTGDRRTARLGPRGNIRWKRAGRR